MTLRYAAGALARLLFLAFTTVTSFYCLMAFLPFTWHAVVQAHLIPQLSWFAVKHPVLWWLFALPVATQTFSSKRQLARYAFPLAVVIFGLYLALHPVLVTLENDRASFFWSLAWLAWPIWLAVIDWRDNFTAIQWAARPEPDDQRLFGAFFLTALFTALLSWQLTWLGGGAGSPAQAFSWTVLAQLALFALLFGPALIITGLAGYFRYPPRAEFVLDLFYIAGLIFLFLYAKVFPSLGFEGPAMSFENIAASLCAALTSMALVLTWGALSCLWRAPGAAPVQSGMDALTRPLLPPTRAAQAVALVCLAIATGLASKALSAFDWNYMLQEITWAIVWVVAFAIFFRVQPATRNQRGGVPAILAVSLIAVAAWQFAFSEAAAPRTLEALSGRNISFRLAHDLLTHTNNSAQCLNPTGAPEPCASH